MLRGVLSIPATVAGLVEKRQLGLLRHDGVKIEAVSASFTSLTSDSNLRVNRLKFYVCARSRKLGTAAKRETRG
jgi:hypothetical protein